MASFDTMLSNVAGQAAVIFISRDFGQADIVEFVMFNSRTRVILEIGSAHFVRFFRRVTRRDEYGEYRLLCWLSINIEISLL
jgi:hypothetical protein